MYSESVLPAPQWCRKRGSPHTKCGSASVAFPVHSGYPESTSNNKTMNKYHPLEDKDTGQS